MEGMDFKAVEEKWQKKWEEKKVFVAKKNLSKKNFYCLEMFPYPSGSGLHIGHALNFTITDIFARFKRMQGFNVKYPIGYDALGLPAENAAIQAGTHPEEYTNNSIKNFMLQQRKMGWSYDHSTFLNTADSNYYRWDQWIFLKLLEKGLAYKKTSNVNWCKKCNTVLANEQVHDGKCWRHGDTEVEIKNLEQWFFKTTHYADELYEGLDKVNWPERTKIMQKNWIGKSYGTEIDFEIDEKKEDVLILHGWEDNSKSGVIPWFKEYLEEKGHRVFTIDCPNAETPNFNRWLSFVEDKIKKNSLENFSIVGHSMGGHLALKLAEKYLIQNLLLIAPVGFNPSEKYFSQFKKDLSREEMDIFRNYQTHDLNIQKVKNNAKKINFVFGEKDPWINGEVVEFYKNNFENIEILKGKKHMSEGEGVKKLVELEKYFKNKKWPIFTTRPDTLFGVTFMVVSAQHSRLKELVTEGQKKEVEKFLKKLKSVSEKELNSMDKEGVFTGSYAKNPINGEKVPVYAGNFVLADYGSGMVMAVPAHDQRDFEFAKKYGLEIKQVIEEKNYNSEDELELGIEAGHTISIRSDLERAYTERGTLMFSGDFSYEYNEEAKEKITTFLKKKKLGRKVINFKLRDWGISRQRYWGTPIPIIYCEKCGIVPVPEKDLPVKLPHDVKFGKGNPLESNEEWIKVKCPKCNGEARRETDTMDTFVNSSWYFLRYCDSKNKKEIFDKKKVKDWCPVDFYVGGAEHACMHLIYSRFYVKFLRDLGLLSFDEPALRLFHQGMLHASGGAKMSKSLGNAINPLDIIQKYNADSLRLALMSFAAPDKDTDWDEKVLIGSYKILNRIIEYFENLKLGKTREEVEIKLNKVIKNITEQIENLKYRKATIEVRQIWELIFKEKEISKDSLEKALKLLSLFCPHISEELFEKLGNKEFISLSSWPKFDNSKIKEKRVEVDLNSKVINLVKGYLKGKKVKKIHLYVMPFEVEKLDEKKLKKEFGKGIFIYSTSDNKKYDPKGRAKKAKPGMPGVWFE